MSTEMKDFACDMFHQAADSFRKTMDAGLKVQEQFTKMWMTPMNAPMSVPNTFEDMRKRGEKMSGEYVAMMEKNVQNCQKALDDQSKTTMDLMKKAFEAAKGQTPAEVQNRTQELFESSMDTVKNYTDCLVRANSQMMENWTHMMGSTCNGHQADKPMPAAAPKK